MSVDYWKEFAGNNYHWRNPHTVDELDKLYADTYNCSRIDLNRECLDGVPRDINILEVGAGCGIQLAALRKIGFEHLFGIEPNQFARTIAFCENGLRINEGTGFNVPFTDGSFDMVYTSGVLIHHSIEDAQKIILEMKRVSRRYIWGFEYYSELYEEHDYHGNSGLLFTGDYPRIIKRCLGDGWKLTREKIIEPYGNNIRKGIMYLFEKNQEKHDWFFTLRHGAEQDEKYMALKGSKEGTLFITGSGGSLIKNDLSLLQNVDVMCLNHSILFSDKFTPKYWAFAHGDEGEFQAYLMAALYRGITCFPCWEMPPRFKLPGVIQYRPLIESDWRASVLDHALHIAEHLGYTRTVLIGVDGNESPHPAHLVLARPLRFLSYIDPMELLANRKLEAISAGVFHGIQGLQHISLADAVDMATKKEIVDAS